MAVCVCEKCGKVFTNLHGLRRHRMSSCPQQQTEDFYECSKCDKKFKRKDSIKEHIRCRHMDYKEMFKCVLCPKEFTTKQNHKNHIRRVHLTEKKKKPLDGSDKICNRCGKAFSNVYKKNYHYKTVHRLQILLENDTDWVVPNFECSDCGSQFTRRDTLIRHIKNHHIYRKSYACPYCARKYSGGWNLRNHIKKRHDQNVSALEIKYSPLENEFQCLFCNQTCETSAIINEHYEKDHFVSFVYENLEFASYAEFENWMNNEKKTFVQVRKRNHWTTETHISKVFRCHRSGMKRQKPKPKRHPKLVGSKKLNGFCPMYITVKESKINGKCSVSYQRTHVGHACEEKELPYLKIKKENTNLLNSIVLELKNNTLLTQNKSIKCEGIDSLSEDVLNHDDAAPNTTIDKCFSLVFDEDSLNMRNFVMKNGGSILFYKMEGEYDARFPTLAKDDFALGYMDNDQEQALVRYGHKIVAFEGRKCIVPNKYILHTVFIQDIDYEGYPVAFLLSNRNDEPVIGIFIQHIKQRVGIVSPRILMSDMQHIYFNAWTEEMGKVQTKLYSLWYVYEAWKKNYSKIHDKQLRECVKKEVENLSVQSDELLFQQKLDNLMGNEVGELQAFLKYFTTFINTKEYWAYCYRNHTGCNSNINIETFHKTFKPADGTKIKSIYECLCFLQRFVQWKQNDIKNKPLVRDKLCYRIRVHRRRHKRAEEQHTSNEVFIKEVSYNCWQVQCFDDTDGDELIQEYIVQKLEVKECIQYPDVICTFPCIKCKICYHEFVCNCFDFVIRNYMCKHIHMLGIHLLNEQFKREELMYEEDYIQEEVIHVDENIFEPNVTDPDTELEVYRHKIIHKISLDLQEAHTPEVLEEIYKAFILPIKPTLKAINELENQPSIIGTFVVEEEEISEINV